MKLLCVIILASHIAAQSASAQTGLDWTVESKGSYHNVTFSIHRVSFFPGEMRFDVVAHNQHKDDFACYFVTQYDNTAHVDDARAQEFKGITYSSPDDQTNKLGPNQRKRFSITLGVGENSESVNVRLGLHAKQVRDYEACAAVDSRPNDGINFHRLNWNIKDLRG